MFMNCVTCVQHIVALSVVLACRQLIAEHLEIISGDTNFCDINEEFLVVSSFLWFESFSSVIYLFIYQKGSCASC